MKNRIILALPAVALLFTVAVAQNQPSGSSSQSQMPQTQNSNAMPQDQPQTQNSNIMPQDQPSQPQTSSSTPQRQSGLEPLTENRQGFWGKLNPFARKKYVQRQLQPIRDRANELDELTANNTRMLHDVDSRATEGIRKANDKAELADMHATDAGNRAQQADTAAQQTSGRLQNVQQVVENLDQYQSAGQVEIRFRPGATKLSPKAREALDDMAKGLKDQRGYVIEVQGFAPGVGQAAIARSQQEADAVVRYLVLEQQIPVYRVYTLGLGSAQLASVDQESMTPAERRAARAPRVQVTLLKNDVEKLAPSNGSLTAGPGESMAVK